MTRILLIQALLFLLTAVPVTAGGQKAPGRAERRLAEKLAKYVNGFNADDNECYINKYPNSQAADFLKDNIPLFECPDEELERTYYFRWWTFRKHIKETPEGYIITEFLPNVSWAGKYNAINCPAMHHFSEGRWLRDPQYLKDYAMFWTREKEEAIKYSYPIAYSFLEFYKVHPDLSLLKTCYGDLKEIYAMWDGKRWDEKIGMYWQQDGYDGMEVSVSGNLSKDATGYRVTLNSYMYADAVALSTIARMLGEYEDAEFYQAKAEQMKSIVNDRLWDESARFYKVIPRNWKKVPETGAMTFSHAREQHGYVPWMFGIPDPSRSDAWLQLDDTEGFKAKYGPTTAERRAKGYKVISKGHSCQWNGPSWPFATSQTLTALARTLQEQGENHASKKMFFETLQTYSNTHRNTLKDGRTVCWIDENTDPDTGVWIARKMLKDKGNPAYQPGGSLYERGKDYNHSTFCDIVISGLIGVQPQLDGSLVIEPLVPEGEWDYFSLTGLQCSGRKIDIYYDKSGRKYRLGKGLSVFVDGKKAASSNNYATEIRLAIDKL